MAPERDALAIGDNDDEGRRRDAPVRKPELGDVDPAASEWRSARFVLDGNAVGRAAAGPSERQAVGPDDSALGGSEGRELSQRSSLPGRFLLYHSAPDQGGADRLRGFARVQESPETLPRASKSPVRGAGRQDERSLALDVGGFDRFLECAGVVRQLHRHRRAFPHHDPIEGV